MIAKVAWLAAVLVPVCAAQSFEVASVRPSEYQSADGESNGHESLDVSPDSLIMRSITLERCIEWAYQVQSFQISGSLGVERFDISARAAGPVPVTTMRAMLGSLLEERFKLALHRERKEISTLDLVVIKGGSRLVAVQGAGPGAFQPSGSTMTAQHASMAEFVLRLSGPLRTPVLDKTDLAGRYDFKVDLTPYLADGADMASIIGSALREELGLNLESRKEATEILVIDHVERSPAEN